MKAGLPVVPGILKSVDDLEEALTAAEGIGYPLLLKPAAGGGGKGMRIVATREELAAAMKAGRAETRKAFGDDRVFVERYIPVARHIEMQIMADRHGNVIHLGERECSVQRRYQKIIEETPSTAVDEGLRRRMGELRLPAGAAGRLHQRRHGRVHPGPGAQLLLPGDEHAPAGGASRDRDGHRAGSRGTPAARRRRRAAAGPPGGGRLERLGHRSPDLRRRHRPGGSCRRPA